MNEDIQQHPIKAGQAYTADKDLWQRVPEFIYEAPAASWVLGNYRTSILLLAMWSILATCAAFAASRRVEV
jgi:hypothetical protein